VSAGWEGSATDARVLRSAMNTPVGKFQVPPGKFYLVDGGYANTPSFLAPYRKVRYHLKEFGRGHRRPQNYNELFKHHHAVARKHAERVLGVLKETISNPQSCNLSQTGEPSKDSLGCCCFAQHNSINGW
jgi:hypothetical protein